MLYERGTALEEVYLIDTGSFKTVAPIHGREQIIGFYFPTDLLGLDGASEAFHVVDAIALKSSAVRVIRFPSLTAFCRDAPALRSQFDQIVNAEAARIAQAAAPLGSRMAKERIASFLLDTSSKF
jgi:CRP/FNR family transcriptional regulator